MTRAPTVICVTPVRNEAWTMERFLRCAERWADVIVLADQGSDDETRAIAERSAKTIVVSNEAVGYDEGERHRAVLEAARSVAGPRAIFAVDADEALSANFENSSEWAAALEASPGTVFTAEWINYMPGGEVVWVPRGAVPFGFIDDGRPHNDGKFHVERVVVRRTDRQVSLGPVKLLHFQYLDWRRMKSKQRRYQCGELLAHPSKSPVQIYRQYHRMDAIPRSQLQRAEPEWTAGYEAAGIAVKAVTPERWYWTDEEVLEALIRHGTEHFRKLDLWDVDWSELAHERRNDGAVQDLRDPRSAVDKLVAAWLRTTQRRGADRLQTRVVQRMLRTLGW